MGEQQKITRIDWLSYLTVPWKQSYLGWLTQVTAVGRGGSSPVPPLRFLLTKLIAFPNLAENYPVWLGCCFAGFTVGLAWHGLQQALELQRQRRKGNGLGLRHADTERSRISSRDSGKVSDGSKSVVSQQCSPLLSFHLFPLFSHQHSPSSSTVS